MTTRTRTVFAFGTHDLATTDEVHAVTTAVAVGNKLRVIIDELLVGNYLEEIACRGVVDDNVYGRVPLGATPDDIARCALPNDILLSTCPASTRTSVCICENDAGCLRDGQTVAKGMPVGVADLNQDGSADDTRFIAGQVGIRCDGVSGPIDVPIDLDSSYWNPSGDQNRPAMGGFDALGPAIVLQSSGPLPTSTTCRLTFAADVVDKQGIGVCAPAGGDVLAGCEPGDLSAFEFGVEPLVINPSAFSNGSTNVNKSTLRFQITAPVDPASLASITLEPAPPGAINGTVPMGQLIQLDFVPPLLPLTQYTLTLPTTIKDTLGQPHPQAKTITFTTGA